MLFFGLVIGAIIFVAGLATYYLAPRVGPNPLFGVRVGYAFASREVWDKTNRAGGILLALIGSGTVALSLLLTLLKVAGQNGFFWLTVALIGALLGATAWMFIYARGLAQATPLAREIKPVKFRWAYLAPVLVTFALLVAVAAYVYPTLPAERMATHFNLAEQPDGWMPRDSFLVSYLGLALLFVALDALAVIVATREPLIAFGRWGARWRLDPERGLIYAGCAFALVNLILLVVLWDVARFNTRGAHLFPLSLLFWMIFPLIAILVALFFLLARREALQDADHATDADPSYPNEPVTR
jgi:uncharacterized membrane protein